MPSTHLPQDKGRHFIHNRYDKFTVDKGKKRKTFLNLIHCRQTNTIFFLTGKGQDNRKSCCTVQQEKKLHHVMSVKTDTLKCTLYPDSIQCERTSFLASFASSAHKKNITCKDCGFSMDTYKFSSLISRHFLKELSV